MKFADLGIILPTGFEQKQIIYLIFNVLNAFIITTYFWHIIGKYSSITIHLKLKLFVNHA